MVYSIAFAGKGGVGKTTTCGLFIDYLSKSGKAPVLAVDADPNSNLNEVLGVPLELTLGEIREEIANAEITDAIPIHMSKPEFASLKFSQAIIEEDGYDLLVMGRTQGKGCYCYVNDLLRDQINRYYKNYNFLVVDNEAGLEHISRGVLPPVNLILLISDCSRRSIQAVGRIAAMIKELDLKVEKTHLIVNRVPGDTLDAGVLEEIEKQELDLIGFLPQDENVYKYDAAGKALVDLPDDSKLKQALAGIVKKLGL
ncbi:MAG: AAA family ATPase [Spirochaetaceae bacterium]|jgi:CO dehydrogenase maturation factor|nr:AAA family ATPase [Spirochaetaceae bacterium]